MAKGLGDPAIGIYASRWRCLRRTGDDEGEIKIVKSIWDFQSLIINAQTTLTEYQDYYYLTQGDSVIIFRVTKMIEIHNLKYVYK